MTGELVVSRKERNKRFEDELIDSLMTAGMLTMVIVIMMPFIQQAITLAASPRVPVRTEGLEAVAGNVGALWLQVTPAGRPNEFRMITENSTGAFEQMLIGLST